MAMLAEPRQKKRYNLVPKGKPLFEDGDRFGTKMLEKMGWSKGKGLGSREDGQQEFIRIRYKNDADGLGYEERDDQWTQHEKHFNGLLESLNGGDPFVQEEREKIDPKVGFGFKSNNASKENLKDKFSGQSLEEKSKNSKARVHYKKFTKGKDMAQYSEKDLANIFGKKTTAGETNIYDQFQAFSTANGVEKKEEENAEVKNPFKLGTQTINTGVSVSDYFKMKMAALKEKKTGTLVNGDASKAKTENDVQNETSSHTKESNKVQAEEDISQKKKKKNKQIMEESEVEDIIRTESCEEFSKKKAKKKRAMEVESAMNYDLEITSQNFETAEDAVDETPQKKKKKKKRDTKALEDKANTTNEDLKPYNAIEERPCKNVKNKKPDTEKEGKHEETVPTELNDSTPLQNVSSKKNKNPKVDVIFIESDDEKSNENFSNTIIVSTSSKKKKSKKNKEDSITNDHVTVPTETEIVVAPVSEKKKKKRTIAEMEPIKQSESEFSTNDILPKKKKKTQNLLIDLTDDNNPSVEHNVEQNEDTVLQATESTNPEEKISKKNKKKDKSTNNPTPLVEVSPPNDLNPLTGPCLPDIYKISTFCAEKFRNVELPRFHDSNISAINGYGLSENLQLKIITIKTDQERIMKLWNGTLNKYTHATPKRKIYNTYITKVKQARQNKSRIPNIKVKALKRQHVFQGL